MVAVSAHASLDGFGSYCDINRRRSSTHFHLLQSPSKHLKWIALALEMHINGLPWPGLPDRPIIGIYDSWIDL